MELKFDANLKWLFTELPFDRRFDAAASAGFKAVEYASPYEYEPSVLRKLLGDAGLKQVLINTPAVRVGDAELAGVACVPGRAKVFRAGVERGLEYAAALGSDFLHVVGGTVPDGVGRQRAFAQYVTNIGWAAQAARDTGVRLLLETQNKRDAPGFILESQRQAADVVEVVGEPGVGLMLDFYHAQIDEGDLVRTFEAVSEYVFHIQVADPPTRNEPGTGEIGWEKVFGSVRDSGYDGWIGCEYRPLSGTVTGLGWMKEFAR